MNERRTSAYVLICSLLALLFFLRVAAQALAAFADIPFLPPMREWITPSASPFSTSGLVPYPILLTAQVLILIFQIAVIRDFATGKGYFVSLSEKTGRILLWLSYLYFGSMALRYIITMTLYPDRRWLGHAVPIILHFVLAGFLFTLGVYQTRRRDTPNRG